jgi:hypothetical protein
MLHEEISELPEVDLALLHYLIDQILSKLPHLFALVLLIPQNGGRGPTALLKTNCPGNCIITPLFPEKLRPKAVQNRRNRSRGETQRNSTSRPDGFASSKVLATIRTS